MNKPTIEEIETHIEKTGKAIKQFRELSKEYGHKAEELARSRKQLKRQLKTAIRLT